MEKKHDKLDEIIYESMKVNDTPSPGLNNCLKVKLYEQEAQNRRDTSTKTVSLWYAPMTLNLILVSLFAVLSLLTITNPFLAIFAAVICAYIGIIGIIITLVGVKRTNLKEELTIQIKKRGAVYEQ